jgi:hypothetical protein
MKEKKKAVYVELYSANIIFLLEDCEIGLYHNAACSLSDGDDRAQLSLHYTKSLMQLFGRREDDKDLNITFTDAGHWMSKISCSSLEARIDENGCLEIYAIEDGQQYNTRITYRGDYSIGWENNA